MIENPEFGRQYFPDCPNNAKESESNHNAAGMLTKITFIALDRKLHHIDFYPSNPEIAKQQKKQSMINSVFEGIKRQMTLGNKSTSLRIGTLKQDHDE